MTFNENNVNRDHAGKFDTKLNTEAEDGVVTPPTSGLDDVLYDRVRKAADFASRAEASAKHRRLIAETEFVRELIRRNVPGGATAVFDHNWNDDDPRYLFAGVLDANWDLVWDRHSNSLTSEFNQAVQALMSSIGDDASRYFDESAEDPRVYDPASITLDLTQPGRNLSAAVSTSAVELDRMTDAEAEDLTNILTRHTGEIRTYQNRASVLDRLRNPEGEGTTYSLPADLLARLTAKYGTEEAAADAIVTSDAWKRYATAVEQNTHGEILGVIRAAAAEARLY